MLSLGFHSVADTLGVRSIRPLTTGAVHFALQLYDVLERVLEASCENLKCVHSYAWHCPDCDVTYACAC